jgi:acetoin utilization protein AcuB
MMTPRVVSVGLDDTLSEIQRVFEHVRFHHLLVIEEGRLFVVISDRDLLKGISPFIGTPAERERDLSTLNKRVHQIMSRKPVTIAPDATMREAARIMIEERVSCLPVVDAEENVCGILTWRDVLKLV